MKLIIKSLFVSLLVFSAVSCKKDFLDKAPDDDLTLKEVFANHDYALNFLKNIYTALPVEHRNVDNDINGNAFVGSSDDMEQGYDRSFCTAINSGAWGPGIWNSPTVPNTTIDPWGSNYVGIRKANIFLENIDNVPTDDVYTPALRERSKGEALFLRAYFHFLLMRLYGPVPVMSHSLTFAEELKTSRTPIEQCVAFVASECDKAAALLPERITATSEYGRPAKSVCLALKARVLLYMASPLWNGNQDYTNIKNADGTTLFPNFAASRWQDAANAAKASIDQAEAAGYGLYFSPTNNPKDNYQEIFYVNNNKELIFCYNTGVWDDHDVYSEPRGMTGTGFTLNGASQNIVDQYEMANGIAPILGYNPDLTPIINPASGYTETGFTPTADPKGIYAANTSMMYVNREPRFYASIHFTGELWKPTRRPAANPELQFYAKGADGIISGANYSRTGYLVKKLANPNFVMSPRVSLTHTWPLFRLGEQYLNYAEALNEAQGPVSDVYKYVNLIRTRSGLPGLPSGLSQEEMRLKIRHERQIELFFEGGFRYFDCHRWKIAEIIDNGNLIGLNISAGQTKTDPAFFKRVVYEKRVFEKKHYLWPMQQREVEKNPNLVQNYGW